MTSKAEHYLAEIAAIGENGTVEGATLLACRLLVEIMQQLDAVIDNQMMSKATIAPGAQVNAAELNQIVQDGMAEGTIIPWPPDKLRGN